MPEDYTDYVDQEVAEMSEHPLGCMCEDCWWAHDQQQVCASCGSVHTEDQHSH